MSRSDQRGSNAPNRGSMIKAGFNGVSGYQVPALSRFPAPDFLTEAQQHIWVAALSDVPLEFFRARHIPLMIQYVRAIDYTMRIGDEVDADIGDPGAINRWERMMRITLRLERHLSMNTEALISMVIRARTELKAANAVKSGNEAGKFDRSARAGLVYVGH